MFFAKHQDSRSSLTRHLAAGFTLMELMLVLTIIVVIGAIAVPNMERLLERQKIRGAADELRLAWDTARIKAMRTGQAQVFKCELGSNDYSIQALILHDDMNNIGSGATMMSGGVATETTSTTFGMATKAADSSDAEEKELDDTVEFVSCIVATDLRSLAVAQSGENAMVNVQTINQSVIFYPDGSTSTAEVKIKNERGETTGVQIRGITGHTKLIDLIVPGEATP
ncbi:MAG: prepilin-type N-terminal cleavage/methylation domain-containing protein [Pirellulales bacterium]